MKPKVYLETTIPSLLTAWPSRDLIIAADQQVTTVGTGHDAPALVEPASRRIDKGLR